MKIKTSELTGAALDLEVAKCEATSLPAYSYSTNWLFGGPIIEREKMKVYPNVGGTWSAQIRHEESHPLVSHKVIAGWTNSAGHTPLIAAMRCYVASKLGNEVEIPDGIILI